MIERRNLMRAIGGAAMMSLAPPVFAKTDAYPFTLRNGRLFIQVAVNGVRAEALLDSGAEATLIDTAAAPRFRIAPGKSTEISGSGAGKQSAQFVPDVHLAALGLDLVPEAVVVTDLADVSRRLAGAPVEVILGREIFDAARLRIAFDKRRITVLSAAERPRGVRLPLTTEHGIETMPISIDGHAASATFDLGNGTRPMVSAAFARKAGWLEGRTLSTTRGGGIGGEKELSLVRLNGVEIAGHRFDDVEFAIEDGKNASDANIGTSLLQHFDIVADYPGKAVWLEYVG